MDNIAIKNILDFFKGNTIERDYDSEFIKAGRKFYSMVTTTQLTNDKIVEEFKALMIIPMSYSDMRSIFG
jgi:hypothetical protein